MLGEVTGKQSDSSVWRDNNEWIIVPSVYSKANKLMAEWIKGILRNHPYIYNVVPSSSSVWLLAGDVPQHGLKNKKLSSYDISQDS